MNCLTEIFSKLRSVLAEKDEVRDSIQEHVRNIVRLSKTVIGLIHRGLLEDAENEAKGFSPLLRRLEELRSLHIEFSYSNSIATAYQEYCEAKLLLAYLREGRIPSWEELSSPPLPYIIGLLDMVGELRRLALENIRRGCVEAAERLLETMDILYDEALKIDSPYAFSAGLRRKLDVARRITEATRSELVLEIRRRNLEEAMRKLEESMKRRS